MLLRQLLRAGRAIKQDLFRLQLPVGGSPWGTHELVARDDPLGERACTCAHQQALHSSVAALRCTWLASAPCAHAGQDRAVLRRLLPGLAVLPSEPVCSRQGYQQLVLSNFRAHAREQDPQAVSDRLDEVRAAGQRGQRCSASLLLLVVAASASTCTWARHAGAGLFRAEGHRRAAVPSAVLLQLHHGRRAGVGHLLLRQGALGGGVWGGGRVGGPARLWACWRAASLNHWGGSPSRDGARRGRRWRDPGQERSSSRTECASRT